MDQHEDELGKDLGQQRNQKTRGRNPRQDNSNKIMDLDELFDEEDEKEMDNFSECQPYYHTKYQENNFASDCRVYSLSFSEQEKPDKFIDEDIEEEDIQPSKPLKPSYRDHWRQDRETIKNDHPLSFISEPVDQLERTEYFTKQDV